MAGNMIAMPGQIYRHAHNFLLASALHLVHLSEMHAQYVAVYVPVALR